MLTGITIFIIILCIALLGFAYFMMIKMQRLEKQLADYQKPEYQAQQPQRPKQPRQPKQHKQSLQREPRSAPVRSLPKTVPGLFQTYTAEELPTNLQEMKLHGAKQVTNDHWVHIDPQQIVLQRGKTTRIDLVAENPGAPPK